ncbi:hypothetical protein SteCoe_474 [Stentor coeruleus]|uniref:Uncharacterized protein n=1 Tax=Stentor coeruleus TaxID=5963 RepID=A0A1R2D4E6_9CILI|nr:hypothetical protein SteCoe_474 [Stentor coeruleus]
MSLERGRQQKDKLEQISNEYSALHTIFKKLTSNDEDLSKLNILFANKWLEIKNCEENNKIQRVIQHLAVALHESENKRNESITHIKKHIQEPLKMYPLKVKKQKRSLSLTARGGGEQEQDNDISSNARGGREQDEDNEDIEEKIRNFEQVHVSDMKQLMLHLIYVDVFYHSRSIEYFTGVYKTKSASEQLEE